jgi:hypothetical protein
MKAPMNANASDGAKVLPIARNAIRKTGRLIRKAETKGKRAAGLQPFIRFRNQNNDGA